MFFKSQFSKINTHYYKILLGSAVLSISLFIFPQLYGEGYHAIKTIFMAAHNEIPLTVTLALTFFGLLLLKPIVTSITLASGGDGGVFAPSLFIGAFLGLLLASILNTFFNADVIPLNFMIIGMAAVLSASIHAPFTAIFLVCGLTNDYTLFIPILAVSLDFKIYGQNDLPFYSLHFSSQVLQIIIIMPIEKIKRNYRKTKYILYKETLVDWKEHFWAFLGSFVGIGIIGLFSIHSFFSAMMPFI